MLEDRVAARLLLDMLTGRWSFVVGSGCANALHRQARDKEWLLDNLVVDLAVEG